MLLIYTFMCMNYISKDNNSKFPKSPNPHSYLGNGVESGRTGLYCITTHGADFKKQ